MARVSPQLLEGAAVVAFTSRKGCAMAVFQRPSASFIVLYFTLGLLVGIVLLAAAVY
jgi:hypothetical protein